ncbi:hypothetical protein A1D30_04725 [Acidovorax sp. GW101-3H11]|nr:hypothetical protein A1D30_04725 [Acidovorax sp. GW101-3H11]
MPHFGGDSGSLGGLRIPCEGLAQAAHGQFHLRCIDHHRGLGLRGGDHLGLDARFAERAEHLAGHTHMAARAGANDADFAHTGVPHDFPCAQCGKHWIPQQFHGARAVIAMQREAEIGLAVLAHVLDDRTRLNVRIGQGAQDMAGNAGSVGYTEHGDLGQVTIDGNAGDDGLFHFLCSFKCRSGRLWRSVACA